MFYKNLPPIYNSCNGDRSNMLKEAQKSYIIEIPMSLILLRQISIVVPELVGYGTK